MSAALVTALLALLLGLQPLTTDLYLPSLPLIQEHLGASMAQTQSTFSALLLAFGVSQLLWGPASDRWGRRPILLTGLALYVIVALGAALAPSMGWLIALRAMQGVALGSVIMAARAIVRDLYAPVQGAQVMSKALSGLGVIACSSPLIGSWLAQHAGWQSTMLALAVFGVLSWVLVWLRFEESVQQYNPQALQPRLWWNSSRSILRNRTFWAYTCTTSCSYAALVIMLAGSSFTFIQALHWNASQVGWLLFTNGLFYIAGTWLCRRCIARWGVTRTSAIGGGLAVVCAVILLALAWAEVATGLPYAAACMIFSLAHGIQQPCGQSGAISPFPHAAGMASALNGFLMMVMAFATGQWLGHYLNGTVYPLVFGMAWWCCCTALASWTLVRRYGQPQQA